METAASSTVDGRSSSSSDHSLEALCRVTGRELQRMKGGPDTSGGDTSPAATTTASHGSPPPAAAPPLEQLQQQQKRKSSDASCASSESGVALGDQAESWNGLDDEGEEEDGDQTEGACKKLRAGGRHVCTYCGLACGKPSVLQKHVRAHTGERPYPCAPCGFAFKTKSNLYKHCKSRAHHLKLASDGLVSGGGVEDSGATSSKRLPSRVGDEPEADVIETDDSSTSDRDEVVAATDEAGSTRRNGGDTFAVVVSSASSSATSLSGGTCHSLTSTPSSSSGVVPPPPLLASPLTPSTPIYKPKFHSVTPTIATSISAVPTSGLSTDTVPMHLAAQHQPTQAEKIPKKRAHHAQAASSCSTSSSSTVSEESSGVCLAKRRNEQFQLHLDIPKPSSSVFADATLLLHPTTSTSSSSPAVTGHRPSHPPPSTTTTSAINNDSSPALASSMPQRSPKLASPEYLQQHISKLISQNAAIVETRDPLWPRRYTKQLSIASSNNVDAELRARERHRRFSEDVAPGTSVIAAPQTPPIKSKLALALLSTENGSGGVVSVAPPALLSAKYVPGAVNRYRSSESSSGALGPPSSPVVVKATVGGVVASTACRTTPESHQHHHPQNPEGSIIKDLLLKTRHAQAKMTPPLSSSPTVTSCMRLSGGSVSSDGVLSRHGREEQQQQQQQQPPSSLQQQQQHQAERRHRSPSGSCSADESVGATLFACTLCDIYFQSAENLEAHQQHYCQRSRLLADCANMSASRLDTRPLAITTPSATYLTDEETAKEKHGSVSRILSSPFNMMDSHSSSNAHKPRGRPKGSKNRPKLDTSSALSPGCGSAVVQHTKFPVRVHSKSVSEATTKPADNESSECPDRVLDVAKLGFRRNSVSGELSSDCIKDILTFRSSNIGGASGAENSSQLRAAQLNGGGSVLDGLLTDGRILKKHLLGGDKSPPPKKRRLPEELFATLSSSSSNREASSVSATSGQAKDPSLASSLRSLEHLSKFPRKTSAVHLFGGEVQICDGAETKKIIIDSNIQSSPPSSSAGDNHLHLSGLDSANTTCSTPTSSSSVVATIAKPVHNSGGTVLQFQDAKSAQPGTPGALCLPVVSVGRPLMATGSGGTVCSTRTHSLADMSGSIVVSNAMPGAARPFCIDISHLMTPSAATATCTTSGTNSTSGTAVTLSLASSSPISSILTTLSPLNISALLSMNITSGAAATGSLVLTDQKDGDVATVSGSPRLDRETRRASKRDDFLARLKSSGGHSPIDGPPPLTSNSTASLQSIGVGDKIGSVSAKRPLEVPIIRVQPPKSPISDRRPDNSNGASSPSPSVIRCTADVSSSDPVASSSGASSTSRSLLAPPRPTSLALRQVHTSMVGTTLVSPETPRPKKKYGQCYLNGQYYTYLELKQSTRAYYCCISRPQPMYVPQDTDPKLSMYSVWQIVPPAPDHFGLTPDQAMALYASRPRYSPYTVAQPARMPYVVTHSSYWTFQQKNSSGETDVDDDEPKLDVDSPFVFDKCVVMASEAGRQQQQQQMVDSVTSEVDESNESDSAVEDEEIDVERTTPLDCKPKTDIPSKPRSREGVELVRSHPRRVRIFEGGFKSNEDYTYVRGRGRGKYLCEECGIRCKKPSMLKKHIRTHTDVRPYTCKHCNFSFKTKGNLTKHMKSKAHHKKCVELGIVPVPVTIDDAQIDEEALARQERIEHQRKQFADVDEDSALEDENSSEEEEDEEYDEDEEWRSTVAPPLWYKEGELEESEEEEIEVDLDGQFEDASELLPSQNELLPPLPPNHSGGESAVDEWLPKCHSEQDVAHSLLQLCKPDAIQVAVSSLHMPLKSSSREYHHHYNNHQPHQQSVSQDMDMSEQSRPSLESTGDREQLIGNPRVVWTQQQQHEHGLGPVSGLVDGIVAGHYGGSRAGVIVASPTLENNSDDYVDHRLISSHNHHEQHPHYRRHYSALSARSYDTRDRSPPVECVDDELPIGHRASSSPPLSSRRHQDRSPPLPFSDAADQPMDLSMPHHHNHHHVSRTPPPSRHNHHQQQQQQQHHSNGHHDRNVASADERLDEEDDEDDELDNSDGYYGYLPARGDLNLVNQSEHQQHQRDSVVARNVVPPQPSLPPRASNVGSAPPRRYEDVPPSVIQSAVELFHRSTGLAVREERVGGGRVRWEEEGVGKTNVLHSYLSSCGAPPEAAAVAAAATRLAGEREAKRHRTDSVRSGHERDAISPQPAGMGGGSGGQTASQQQHSYSPTEAKLHRGVVGAGEQRTSLSLMPMFIHRSMEDGKSVCSICNKAFSKPSQLRLHINIHYFERPFRCDSCAISFRTKGHLQKHKRSVSHYNKVNMNMTFGTPTTDNPRPFKCDDCKIAFRIHGHLAKHLRSKMHIMKLECLGKLPFGTYAEIERSGANLNEIDTTDCDNSLESLQLMAMKLVEKVPAHERWTRERTPRERTVSGGSCDDQSDGVPYIESPLDPVGLGAVGAAPHDSPASPDLSDASRLVMWSQQRSFQSSHLSPESPDDLPTTGTTSASAAHALKRDVPHLLNARPGVRPLNGHASGGGGGGGMGQRTSSVGSLVQDYEDISEDDEGVDSEAEQSSRPTPPHHPSSSSAAQMKGTVCGVCGKVLESSKFLHMHMFVEHPGQCERMEGAGGGGDYSRMSTVRKSAAAMMPDSSSWNRMGVHHSTAAPAGDDQQHYSCELCGEICDSHTSLKRHMIAHAQLRPFVCDICDAGFTNAHYLKLHLQSHQQDKGFSCSDCTQVCASLVDLEHHMDLAHPIHHHDADQVR